MLINDIEVRLWDIENGMLWATIEHLRNMLILSGLWSRDDRDRVATCMCVRLLSFISDVFCLV